MKEIFKDLVVVELASVLAGPAVGMFFAELGAQVVKFENKKTGGDITRKWKLNHERSDLSYSAYYCAVNYEKKIIMNDLSSAEGKDEVMQWIKKADIVIANFKESSARRMGLAYEQVRQIKRDIIYAQLNGYPSGSKKVAFDVVLQAESGFLSMCGLSSGETAKMPVALIDLMAAHQLKEGILIALLKRYKSGEGSYVVSSLYESAIASLANQATNWLMNKSTPKKMGTLHPNIAPYGEIVKTKDSKEVVLAIGTDKQFENLCSILGVPHLSSDNSFTTNTTRVKNRSKLHKILLEIIVDMNASDFILACENAYVPVGEIKNLQQVFLDPAAQKMVLIDEDNDGNIRKRVRTIAFSMV